MAGAMEFKERELATPPAWPRSPTGELALCEKTSVLEDHRDGYPAKCMGLEAVDNKEHTAEECEEYCTKFRIDCSEWQLTTQKKCWRSGNGHYPTDCWTNKNGADVLAGQRVQRGRVDVEYELKDQWIEGLKNLGILGGKVNEASIIRCKLQCYTDINCRVWQYGVDGGCWVERAPGNVLPEDKPKLSTDEKAKAHFVAGEVIRHTCADQGPRMRESSESSESSNDSFLDAIKKHPVPLGIAAGLLLFCCVGLVLCHCCPHGSHEDEEEDAETEMKTRGLHKISNSENDEMKPLTLDRSDSNVMKPAPVTYSVVQRPLAMARPMATMVSPTYAAPARPVEGGEELWKF
eukprot:gnl/TRDRNA2_/TRDRNA2_187935_c0_seq1.p1 gnl/TRDRNA2_/TRDRNA2_187935_c0~~gnl/TRDRNA2_/TRDRNA2_187935_c0_seq1.p1  ORF type:complete len:389 (-),score=49.25 gnl/TRDRNA2_/TRDRNA2_187935_c0_seq1:154-1197(-)